MEPAILPPKPHHPKPPYTIRPAIPTDLPAIHQIYTYYVLNSSISLLLHAPSISYLEKGYQMSMARKMPYLVAVADRADLALSNHMEDPSTSAEEIVPLDQNESRQNPGRRDLILGYAHVVPLTPDKAGYGPAVELTMYLHPFHLSLGIGSVLLSSLEIHLSRYPILVFEEGHEGIGVERKAEVMLARMSNDVERDFEGVKMMGGRGDGSGGGWPVWRAQGEKNRAWYLSRGFEEVGRMKGVGEKFGKRTDVIILQKTLTA